MVETFLFNGTHQEFLHSNMFGKKLIEKTNVQNDQALKSVWRLVKCPECGEVLTIHYDCDTPTTTCAAGHTFVLVGNGMVIAELVKNGLT